MPPDDPWNTAIAWLNTALERRAAGHLQRAEDALLQAVSQLEAFDDDLTAGNIWLTLAQVRLERGDALGAIDACTAARACFARGEHETGQARVLLCEGEALLWRSTPREAAARLEDAAIRLVASGVLESIAWCRLGDARRMIDDQAGARDAYRRAAERALALNAPALEARAGIGLGWTALRDGALDEAMRHVTAAIDVADSVSDRAGVGWGLLLYAEVAHGLGRPGEAWRATRRAAVQFRLTGCAEGQGEARARRSRWPWWRVLWCVVGLRLAGGRRALPDRQGR